MDMLEYENPLIGVKMKYPADWTKTENVPGAVVSFSPSKENSATSPSIGLVTQNMSSMSMCGSAHVRLCVCSVILLLFSFGATLLGNTKHAHYVFVCA